MDAYEKIAKHEKTINQLGAALQRMQKVEWKAKNGVQSTIGVITLEYYSKALQELEDAFGDDAYALRDLRVLLNDAQRRVLN